MSEEPLYGIQKGATARRDEGGGRMRVFPLTLAGAVRWRVGQSKLGSYLRLIDSCITQLKAQGPSRTWNESKEEEEESRKKLCGATAWGGGSGAPQLPA